jgi:D-3-phosphoglycerate dehydrogenase
LARILTSPFERALVVEGPHATLDGYLMQSGITAFRENDVVEEDALIQALNKHRAQVLFKRSRVPVTRRVIESCPDLYAVQLCCIGDDSVDKDAAADHGVMVFNDPLSNAQSVVELAVGHLVALSRRLYETNEQAHRNDWQKNNRYRYEVGGKVLGIVGLGNIGRQVARAAQALGMEIRFYDNRLVAQEVGQEMGWQMVDDLATLFRTSDYVTTHTSARDAWGQDNTGMLTHVLAELGRDRPETSPRIFLNLARGNLYDVQALRQAVQDGAIRRAAVDVYPQEPGAGETWENPYADLPTVICTPHIGAATQEAQPRIARRVARTLGRFSRMGRVRDCVYAQRASLQTASPKEGHAVLAVVHSTRVGTKKAVADAIYEAKVSTLGSAQQDFSNGAAYEVSLLERPLTDAELARLVSRASELAEDDNAIRSVRQMVAPAGGWR